MKRRPRPLTARDIMTRRPITFRPDTNIKEAITVLLRRDISGAPVVDEAGGLVGILSEHDCLKVLALAKYDAQDHEESRTVADFMSEEIFTVPPEEGIYSLANHFLTLDIRRLPVIHDGRLVGLVSRRDVLRGIRLMIRKHSLPPLARRREPKLYPSATDTPPGAIGDRLK